MKFRKISEIKIEDHTTWEQNNIFLTFDLDWVHDEVLSYTIDLVEQADVAATWFVTHNTPILKRLQSNPKFELGIHPNFNFLLNGDFQNGSNAEEVIDRLLDIVPNAQSVRSHSLVQGSILSNLFVQKKLIYESNLMITAQAGVELAPYSHVSGIVAVPFCWGDYHAIVNHRIKDAFTDLNQLPELRVLNFHPIHVFLNTEHINRYQSTKHIHHETDILVMHRYQEYGTRSALEDLIGIS